MSASDVAEEGLPSAPPPPLTPPAPAAALRYSFSQADKDMLREKLLSVKISTAELRDPVQPCTLSAASEVPAAGLAAQSVEAPSLSPKWNLVEGVDFKKAGWYGDGDPIFTQKTSGCFGRPAHDGGGLCSPGRWVIGKRNLPPKARVFTDSMDKWLDVKAGSSGEAALQAIVFSLFGGKLERHPFEGELAELKHEWATILANAGLVRPAGRWVRGRTIDFGMMHLLGNYLGDPDFESMTEFCNGVRIGVDSVLHRTWEVWPPKRKWPLCEFGAEDVVSELNSNYPSAVVHREVLLAELEDQLKRGWAVETTLGAAQAKYGTVSISPLAIIEERGGKYRTLFDATRKVQVNHRIRVRDGEQCPSALDIQACVSADNLLVRPVLALVVDIEKAHQQVPLAEEDWRHIACSPDPKPESPEELLNWRIYLKTVGTYGVSSASWQWCRVGSLFQRLAYYICRLSYLFRFADDYMLVASNLRSGRFTRQILRFVILVGILDIPLKWPKTRGGLSAEFVGYIFEWESFRGGLSERRCSWICGWCRKMAADRMAVGRELRGGLGRISFSAVLWRYLLPYLGPFYSWISVIDNSAAWPLPTALIILLLWIADEVEKNPLVTLRHLKPMGLGRFFKGDAKAEGLEVCVGGFEAVPGLPLDKCRWFSVRLTPESTPWAYVKENEAYRTIATLELFCTLLCVVLFVEPQPMNLSSTLFYTGVTDNQGNVAMVSKAATSKFPLYIVHLELTMQLRARNINLDLRWQQRESNTAADSLTNSDFTGFNLDHRICPNLNELGWIVLPKLLAAAMLLDQSVKERKAEMRTVAITAASGRLRKRKAIGLKESDPW